MNEKFLARFQLLDAKFPKNSDDFSMRSVCESILPEALVFLDEPESSLDSIPVAIFMARVARFLKIKVEFQAAESLARRSLNMIEKLVTTNDPQLCLPLSTLGNILCACERADEAEIFLKRALSIAETAYGENSAEVATALNDVGNVLYFIDQQQCEEVFRRALKIRQTILPPNHPDTATSMSDLGAVISQNEPELAEELLRQALAIREKNYGNNHPDVAITLDNIALLLDEQQREEEALELSQRAVAIFEKCFGLSHPDVVIALRNMAIRLRDNRKEYSEAEKYYRRTKDAVEMLFGEDSVTMAEACYDLGVILRMQEEWSEAEIYFRSALGIHEQIYGASHPDIAKDLNQLASVLEAEGNLDDAETLFRRALSVVEEEFIEPHTRIALALYNLAHLLEKKDCYQEAKLIYLRSLENYEATSQDAPIKIATTLYSLADVLLSNDELQDAEIYARRALQIEEEEYGEDAEEITFTCMLLGRILQAQYRYDEAESIFLRQLAIEEAISSEDIAKTLTWVGSLYQKMQRWQDVAQVYRRILSIVGAEEFTSFRAVRAADHLSRSLFELGQYEEAISLLEKTLPYYEQYDYIDYLADAHHRLADLRKYSGRVLEAKPHYDRAVELEESLFDSSKSLMNLYVEAGARIDMPSADDIARELSELSFPDKKFAIIENGELFIQAYRNEDGTFTLEHSEGSVDRMFKYEPASIEEAVEAMQRFISGAGYQSVVPFQPLDLS